MILGYWSPIPTLMVHRHGLAEREDDGQHLNQLLEALQVGEMRLHVLHLGRRQIQLKVLSL